MHDVLRIALSCVVWLIWLVFTAAWTIVVAVVWALTVWWDRRRAWASRTFRLGARCLVLLNPFWRVRIKGRLPSRETIPFVAVCNHESLADVLIVGSLPFEMKWLSKEEIARVPFVGWMMRMAGDVLVRRNDPRSRGESYDELAAWIDRGSSIMMFPEGTRSRSGRMLPFRSGAFRLAIETGRPVQPLAVSGTRRAIKADSVWFGRADVTVTILDQVDTADVRPEDVNELRDRVRDMVVAAREA